MTSEEVERSSNKAAGKTGMPGIECHLPTDERPSRAMIELFEEVL